MKGPYFLRLKGNRVRMTHGPLDLVAACEGPEEACEMAYGRGWKRFQSLLAELSAEADLLRAPLADEPPPLEGRVALRMLDAAWPFRSRGVAPVAAAAGAMTEDIMEAMLPAIPIRTASVDSGSRAALWLHAEEKLVIEAPELADWPKPACIVTVKERDPSRGIASAAGPEAMPLAVTALAARAAEADVAAAMIAAVAGLAETPEDALAHSQTEARILLDMGVIHGAALLLHGETRVIGERERLLPHQETSRLSLQRRNT
jgi:uncharacterized protein